MTRSVNTIKYPLRMTYSRARTKINQKRTDIPFIYMMYVFDMESGEGERIVLSYTQITKEW
jgi:hypothetical protein